MVAYRSVMEAVRYRFTARELLSYKEVFEEVTEEWYAQRDPDEVDREECNCIRLAEQFWHLMEEYRERFFTYLLLESPTRSVTAHLESYLLHMHYTSELYNLYDIIEVNMVNMDNMDNMTEIMRITKWGGGGGVIVELVYSKQ